LTWKVLERVGASELIVEKGGRQKALALSHAGKFSVFKEESISLSVGDQIRVTKNFQTHGLRFRNNELHTVSGLASGKLVLGYSFFPGSLHALSS
jgi:hypothetical protein